MSPLSKYTEKLIEHIAEASVAAISILLVYVAKELTPVVLPIIESELPYKTLLALFLASLAVNLVVVFLIYLATRKPELKLRYGIYWDKYKNAHCPACRNPVATYGDYGVGGKGYYCKTCNDVFPLADAAGNSIAPSQAITQL